MTALLASRRLFFFLLLKAALIIAIIFYAGIGLGPDEAQYWTWSQALDWGYYSKPPGIAWQIWLGTKLFGDTEWGVRSLSVVISFFQAYLVYFLALAAGLVPRAAFWCALFMAFSPLGIMGSLFAITDGGFLLCWTGACLAVVSALQRKVQSEPLVVGSWLLVGALFKWPIYFFWLLYVLCLYLYFPDQKRSRVSLAIALSLLGLLPSLWWNASHDWATFRHVFATLQGGSGHAKGGANMGEFIGTQAALLSPILFFLLIAASFQWFRQRRQLNPPLVFCGFATMGILGAALVVSCFQKIQGNWAIFAYPTAMILLGWFCFQEIPRRIIWAKVGLVLSVGLTACVFLLPSLYTNEAIIAFAPPYRINPFKHNMGWEEIKQVLARNGYDAGQHFLAADKYQTASILSFYGEGQKRAYFLNLQHQRNNQFSFWPSLQEERQGETGYFVWVENKPHLNDQWEEKRNFYQTALENNFETVEFLEFASLIKEGKMSAKAAMIFRCSHCLDNKLLKSNKY